MVREEVQVNAGQLRQSDLWPIIWTNHPRYCRRCFTIPLGFLNNAIFFSPVSRMLVPVPRNAQRLMHLREEKKTPEKMFHGKSWVLQLGNGFNTSINIMKGSFRERGSNSFRQFPTCFVCLRFSQIAPEKAELSDRVQTCAF